MVEKACPTGQTEPDEDFECVFLMPFHACSRSCVDSVCRFYIKGTSWELMSIRWEWDVSPPPPPPATLTLYQELLEADPRGYELGRKTMDELYPDLRYIATASVGGSVGRFPVDREVRNTVSFTHVAFKTHR